MSEKHSEGPDEDEGDEFFDSLPPDVQQKMMDDFDAADARTRALGGAPRHYEWFSPDGKIKLEIEFDAFHARGHPWRLTINGDRMRQFPDWTDAMVAVCQHTTGHSLWDSLKGQVRDPDDEKDWSTRT